MFDNLLNLVKEHAGDAIINNPAIPNEKNDEAINATTNSIMDTLKTQVSSGNLNGIMDLFKGGNVNASGISSALNSNVVSDLMKKFNIDQSAASGIASNLLPKVMDNFVKKTNDPNDSSFDLQGILSNLGGGGAGGLMDTVKGFFK
ncbi:MAG: hypothetical protein QM534_06690 [Sediminibacterium sp.]|nr:hypothetical protein [Sediminibacterium sp.]